MKMLSQNQQDTGKREIFKLTTIHASESYHNL